MTEPEKLAIKPKKSGQLTFFPEVNPSAIPKVESNQACDWQHELFETLLKPQINHQRRHFRGEEIDALWDEHAIAIDNDAYRLFQEELLAKIAERQGLQRPDYLVEWLTGALKRHDRGLFLLQAEKAMGKTTFCRMIDELSESHQNLLPDHLSVRAYYVDERYYFDIAEFANVIYDQFRRDREGSVVLFNMKSPDPDQENHKRDMADYLNLCFEAHQEMGAFSQLLFVIEAFSEVWLEEGTAVSMLDLIPDPEMLNEGVYILLTACQDQEFKNPPVRAKIDELYFAETVHFERSCSGHRKVIEKIIAAHELDYPLPKELSVEKIIEAADSRIDYLKLMLSLPGLAGSDISDSTCSGSKLFESYLKTLESAYGKKYFHRVIDILVAISVAPVPISFNELDFITREPGKQLNRASAYHLLAAVRDLSGLLRIEKNSRGEHLIAISSLECINLIGKRYRPYIEDLVGIWLARVISLVKSDLPWWEKEHDGATYLFSAFWVLVDKYRPKLKAIYLEDRLDRWLLDVADSLILEAGKNYLLERVLKILSNAKEIWEELTCSRRWQCQLGLADLYLARSKLQVKLNEYEEAIYSFGKALEIAEPLDRAGRIPDRFYLAVVYYDYAKVLTKLRQYHRALNCYESLLKITDEIGNLKAFAMPGFLACIIYERGKVLQSMHRIEEALADYTLALEQFQQFDEDGLLSIGMIDYAEVLLSRAFILTMKSRHQEALADYNQALKIIQQLQDGDEQPDRSLMANLYTNRAVTLVKLGNAEEALLDFDDALEIVRHLESNDSLIEHNILLMCYFNRAVALELVDRLEEALADLEKCVLLIETSTTLAAINEIIDLDEMYEKIGMLNEKNEEKNSN